MNVLSRTCQSISSLWLAKGSKLYLQWRKGEEAEFLRTRGWESMFSTAWGGEWEVVCDDATATRAVLSPGQWFMKYQPQAKRPKTHDSGMQQKPPRWADHQPCQEIAPSEAPGRHIWSSPWPCAAERIWPHANSWQRKRQRAIPPPGVFTLPSEAKALSAAPGPCRGWAPYMQGVSLAFQDAEGPFHSTLNTAPYFIWYSMGELSLLLEGQPLHWGKWVTVVFSLCLDNRSWALQKLQPYCSWTWAVSVHFLVGMNWRTSERIATYVE